MLASEQTTVGAVCALENMLELPPLAEESAFFEDICPVSNLSLQPYERMQVVMLIGSGELGLAVSARVGNVCRMLPKVLSKLSGPLWSETCSVNSRGRRWYAR